jgi:MFS transporter, PPP family, 3-phenylpropionic acid transporter
VESGEVLVYLAFQGIMTARIFGLRFSIFYAFLTIGTGMQLPFLPLWLHAKGLTVAEIGLVIAGMTACRFVAIPVAAYFADRYRNRRGLIILFSLASAFGYLLLGLSSGFLPIFACAILASICIAPIFTLAESFSVDGSAHHGLDYGRLRLWGSISFLLGNLGAGALLLHIPIGSLIYLIALAQGASFLVAFLLPPDPDFDRPLQPAERPANIFNAFRILMTGSFVIFIVAVSLGQSTHGMLYSFGPVEWDRLGYDKFTIGCFWAISIIGEVSMFAFSNALVKRFGAINLILIGISGGFLRWLFMSHDFGLVASAVLQSFHAVSFTLLHLGTMHYIRLTVPQGLRNSAQGLYAAFSGGIAMSGMMAVSGMMYGQLLGGTYLVMAATSLAALSFAFALKRVSPKVLVPLGT